MGGTSVKVGQDEPFTVVGKHYDRAHSINESLEVIDFDVGPKPIEHEAGGQMREEARCHRGRCSFSHRRPDGKVADVARHEHVENRITIDHHP